MLYISIFYRFSQVYRHSPVRKTTGSEVKWAECMPIIQTGYRVQGFGLILDGSIGLWEGIHSAGDLVSQTFKVLILHSAKEGDLSPFDSKIACPCQSFHINNNKHVYRKSQVRNSTDSEVKWAERSIIIGTVYRVSFFSLILDGSVGLWVCIESASDLMSQTFKVRILHSTGENNLSPFDSKISCLYRASKLTTNKYFIFPYWVQYRSICRASLTAIIYQRSRYG